jgi:hypothetical protein
LDVLGANEPAHAKIQARRAQLLDILPRLGEMA